MVNKEYFTAKGGILYIPTHDAKYLSGDIQEAANEAFAECFAWYLLKKLNQQELVDKTVEKFLQIIKII